MKVLKIILYLLALLLVLLACQQEIYFDEMSIGKLIKDASGNCLPVLVTGTYKVDSTLTNKSYSEVQVDVSFRGTYDIISDTVNGYFFHQSGNVEKGTSTIRLYPKGKPVVAGTDHFTVKYGTSTCNFYVTVSGLQPAVYTLAGAPDLCSGVFADGTYTIATALTPSNILTVQVIVTTPGFYTLNAATTNGFSFTGAGIFTTTGLQHVILKGTGIPIRAEVSTVTVSAMTSACHFGIPVLSDTAGKAIFSFNGSPDACINFTVNGSFYAGIVTTTDNSVTMSVNVTRPGSYTITTNTANGIIFSNSGAFISTGPQTVTLLATGTPLLSESTAFVPNTGTVSCNFSLDVEPLPPPAVFTLSGAPNTCSSVMVNGFYIVSKPLDAANTAVIQVNVSTPGSYTLTTNTVNGFSFSASGVFTTPGIQNVILRGSGTPQVAGTTILTPRFGTSSCTFSVTVI